MRSTLIAATAIVIALGFVLPAVDAAAISPNASTGIYSAEQPNLLLVGKHLGKKGRKKGHRQSAHKGRHRGGSRTVVVNNNYRRDSSNEGAALVIGLIVGAAAGSAINK